MDDLLKMRHRHEQDAYHQIRLALSEDYLEDPVRFVEHFGGRPEDLSGAQLREYYPHFLAQGRELVEPPSPAFERRFRSGGLF